MDIVQITTQILYYFFSCRAISFAVLATGCFLAAFLLYPIVKDYKENATISKLESSELPAWQVDFPALTICPTHKIKDTIFEEGSLGYTHVTFAL